MFYLQRQNRKNEKIQNGNRKSQKLKNPQNIKSQIQCFLEEKHMFSWREIIEIQKNKNNTN